MMTSVTLSLHIVVYQHSRNRNAMRTNYNKGLFWQVKS